MQNKTITLQSHAKINLGLLIKGKRPDGYHLLETLFYPVELHDTLVISPAETVSVHMSGMEEQVPLESNLIYKAWKLLADHDQRVGLVAIEVEKRIPAGGGLGGGSSNAGFTLRGLNELFSLGYANAELAELSAPLGADVPFFCYGTPMMATGIGQDLKPFELELPYEIRLVMPPIHSSTPAAYKGLDLSACDPDRSLEEILRLPVAEWREKLVNDLEPPVFKQYPELAWIKEELYTQGAVYAAMTGSGAVMFGLFVRE